MNVLIPLGIFSLIAIGVVQLALGWAGIEHHLGWWGGVGAVFLFFFFRFTLPITVGVYFGVVDVLGWPWWAGVLIAAPGLLFVVPTIIAAILGFFVDR